MIIFSEKRNESRQLGTGPGDCFTDKICDVRTPWCCVLSVIKLSCCQIGFFVFLARAEQSCPIMKTYWRVSLEQTTTLREVIQCIIPLLIINTIHLPSSPEPCQPDLSCCEEITRAVTEDIPGNDISFTLWEMFFIVKIIQDVCNVSQ